MARISTRRIGQQRVEGMNDEKQSETKALVKRAEFFLSDKLLLHLVIINKYVTYAQ